MSIDMALIERFEAVFRRCSFSRAADELGMTHSAMTKSIRTLETLWGVTLFERTTRSVTPTAAGRRLAELAPQLLAYTAECKVQVQAAHGHLSVICGPAISETYLPAALVALHRDFPAISLEVESLPPDLAIERLLQRRAHLLLYHRDAVSAYAARRDLAVRPVLEEPYHLLCTRGHRAAFEGDSQALLDHDWAIAGFGAEFATNLEPQWREQLRRAGFPRFRLSSQAACVAMARSGQVLTLLPRSAALQVCADGSLVSRELKGITRLALLAVTLAEADNPLAAAAIAAVGAGRATD